MKVFLNTIGCRLNQSEIEKMAVEFRAAGHTIVDSPDTADLVVVNTCAVTGEAVSDSRGAIRRAARSGHAQIIATGCWATLEPSAAGSLPLVRRVLSNTEKDHLVARVLDAEENDLHRDLPSREPLPGMRRRTRAFIKAQDGCDNYCTFCVTRLARGKSRSLPLHEVLNDVNRAYEGGAKEVVLTGVQLGSWGRDFNPSLKLSHLMTALLENTHIPRIRLSSVEPWDLDEVFFNLWQNPRLCAHLHLPLQSGCRATLRRMGRKTTPEGYAELVRLARSICPDLALTTDIIVGFPGETEDEFSESLSFIEQMHFAGGHVFHFSPRAGTPAERLPGQVALKECKQRSMLMRTRLAHAARSYQEQFIGKEVEVLWQSAVQMAGRRWQLEGLSGNYLQVSAEAEVDLYNRISRVVLDSWVNEKMAGRISG